MTMKASNMGQISSENPYFSCAWALQHIHCTPLRGWSFLHLLCEDISSGPGPRFIIKMTSYQYRKSHCGDKKILRPSYLHNGISYTGKMASLYWISALYSCCARARPHIHCTLHRGWTFLHLLCEGILSGPDFLSAYLYSGYGWALPHIHPLHKDWSCLGLGFHSAHRRTGRWRPDLPPPVFLRRHCQNTGFSSRSRSHGPPHWIWSMEIYILVWWRSGPDAVGCRYLWTGNSGGFIFRSCNRGSWWCRQMETFSALLALCAGNSPVTGEFPAQTPVARGVDVFFDLRLNKRLSNQTRRWWFEMPLGPLWRHRYAYLASSVVDACAEVPPWRRPCHSCSCGPGRCCRCHRTFVGYTRPRPWSQLPSPRIWSHQWPAGEWNQLVITYGQMTWNVYKLRVVHQRK